MNDDKKLEMISGQLDEDQLEEVAGGCEDHDPDHYAVIAPCVRCAYKYMTRNKPCPCCGASWEEQVGGF